VWAAVAVAVAVVSKKQRHYRANEEISAIQANVKERETCWHFWFFSNVGRKKISKSFLITGICHVCATISSAHIYLMWDKMTLKVAEQCFFCCFGKQLESKFWPILSQPCPWP
jgi:hypothetical protein